MNRAGACALYGWVVVVNPRKIATATVADFIAYAKANAGKVAAATQGNGTTSHLTSELFQMMGRSSAGTR
jgi:tripartite-type tricarboxylate transporter receptor subunit TctC